MKNIAKLIVIALAVVVIASFVVVFASAENYEIVPGSERVYFIRDLEEGYTGRGLGTSPDDPFIPDPEPEGYDPVANVPKYHLTTAFYQAIEMLEKEGGTIVITGPVTLGSLQSYGSGANTKDVFTPYFKAPIKFTSVWDGVDYRVTNNAHILLTEGAEIGVNGESIWENITIVTGNSDRCISFNNYKTIVGEGVECRPESEDFEGVNTYYVSLSAGHRYNKLIGTADEPKETHLIVRSGTYNKIVGGAWGTTVQGAVWADKDGDEEAQTKFYKYAYNFVNCYLTLEGTTEVLGEVCGTIAKVQFFGGNTLVEINGGRYECDINGGGPTSFINEDAKVEFVINGGDFIDCYSFSAIAPNPKGSYPAVATIDFTNFPESEKDSLYALFDVTSEFELEDIKFPSWWVDPSEITETDPPATTTPDVPDTSDTPDSTSEIADSSEDPDETKDPDASAEPDDSSSDDVTDGSEKNDGSDSAKETKKAAAGNQDEDDGGVNVWLIIGIVAGVVVIAGVVAAVLISKKKKGSDAE